VLVNGTTGWHWSCGCMNMMLHVSTSHAVCHKMYVNLNLMSGVIVVAGAVIIFGFGFLWGHSKISGQEMVFLVFRRGGTLCSFRVSCMWCLHVLLDFCFFMGVDYLRSADCASWFAQDDGWQQWT
jgi:hypothetical protein